MAYLFDANCFIQPYNSYYAFDLAPGYWDFLEHQAVSHAYFVIDEVRDEILHVQDDLAGWFSEKLHGIEPMRLTNEMLACLTEINDWVNHSSYTQPKKHAFQNGADPFLIAHAKAIAGTVVTCEKPHVPGVTKKIRIPDLCEQMEVKWMPLFEYLRLHEMKLQICIDRH